LVAGLDPANRVLWDRYNPIVRQYSVAIEPPPEVRARNGVIAPTDRAVAEVLSMLRKRRSAATPAIQGKLGAL